MKKILLGIALSVVALQGCKKDNDEEEVVPEISVEEQKTYDDTAAKDFMTKNYLNSKGVITAFDDTVTTDDNEKKLIDYDYKTLPSGVIYIVRPGAQPEPGKVVGSTDVISVFQVAKTYTSSKVDDKIIYNNEATFVNSIATGNVVSDTSVLNPTNYFYVKQSVLDAYNKANSTSIGKDFYEIEGFQEGLKYFKSFDLDNSAEYNMQGVIIVPSRAAYGRDNSIYGTAYRNRSFVFNFQLYNTRARLVPKED